MVDFEKATHNALEEIFIAVISGCFFHLAQNVFRQIQWNGLTARYLEDEEFSIQMKMLPSLAFLPEHDVIDSFTLLMADFPESAKGIAEYFETTISAENSLTKAEGYLPFLYGYGTCMSEQHQDQLEPTIQLKDGITHSLLE